MSKFGDVMRKRVLKALNGGMSEREASEHYKVPLSQIQRWKSAGNKMFSFGPKQIAIQQRMKKPAPAQNLFDPEIARQRREEEERKAIQGRILEDLTANPEDFMVGPEIDPTAAPPREIVARTALSKAEERVRRQREASARYAARKRAAREAADPAFAARMERRRAKASGKPMAPAFTAPVVTARDQTPYLFEGKAGDVPVYVPLPLAVPVPDVRFTELVASARPHDDVVQLATKPMEAGEAIFASGAQPQREPALVGVSASLQMILAAVMQAGIVPGAGTGPRQPAENPHHPRAGALVDAATGPWSGSPVGYLPPGALANRVAARKAERRASFR
jgi:hypothetical protein